jgi:hypothetical protein
MQWGLRALSISSIMTLRAVRVLVLAWCAVSAAGCRERASATAAAPAQAQTQTTWRKLGEWSGSGSQQTDSFTSDSGALRIHWKTTAQPNTPQPGSFLLTLHSSISGRALQVAVDERGAGEKTVYVSPDPHVFFARIESTGLDWKFSVEEGYSGPVLKTR